MSLSKWEICINERIKELDNEISFNEEQLKTFQQQLHEKQERDLGINDYGYMNQREEMDALQISINGINEQLPFLKRKRDNLQYKKEHFEPSEIIVQLESLKEEVKKYKQNLFDKLEKLQQEKESFLNEIRTLQLKDDIVRQFEAEKPENLDLKNLKKSYEELEKRVFTSQQVLSLYELASDPEKDECLASSETPGCKIRKLNEALQSETDNFCKKMLKEWENTLSQKEKAKALIAKADKEMNSIKTCIRLRNEQLESIVPFRNEALAELMQKLSIN